MDQVVLRGGHVEKRWYVRLPGIRILCEKQLRPSNIVLVAQCPDAGPSELGGFWGWGTGEGLVLAGLQSGWFFVSV